MDFAGRPNFEKMLLENDRNALYACLNHHDRLLQVQAAQALALLGDGAGWHYLTDAVLQEDDATLQEAAASVLGDLGARSAGDAHRAVPSLAAALKTAHGETADTLRDALETIGGQEAEAALAGAGYTATAEESAAEVNDYEAHFIRPILPDTSQIEFLSADAHLNTAVDLREAEHPERGLVECSLALWLKPGWAYAWYLRGVLFEDLDRPFEAWLAYRRAVSLDPSLEEAIEALEDIEAEGGYAEPQENDLLQAAGSLTWQERRDAAAGLGELGEAHPEKAVEYAAALLDLLRDDEREVRCAAIHSLGQLESRASILPLLAMRESSWLLRFSRIEALARMGSVDGLVEILAREMEGIMERNPSFSSHKDALVEVEYERLVETGVLALERTGDLEGLVAIAEGNAWEEVDEQETADLEEEGDWERVEMLDLEALEEDDDGLEAEEDLSGYVDEVGWMVSIALDRSARPRLASLKTPLLERLAAVPDLTLMDLSENPEEDAEPQPALVCDLSGLRAAAQSELKRRGGKAQA